MKKLALALALVAAIGTTGLSHSAGAPEHNHHQHHAGHDAAPAKAGGGAKAAPAMQDARLLVKYPADLRIHTLANMRDHLATLGAIQAALAQGSFDKASDLAESRLGMSSLGMHGAHAVSKYMPKAMQEAGTAMHRTASQFAVVAKDASVSGDFKPVLASLAKLNQTCVACHAGFRLQ